MPESAQKVLHELTAAGILSSDKATDFGDELNTGADALLSRLVADGHITQFQADKFLAGQSSDIYFGDYVVLDKLGQGGMGTVFLARHKRMDRKVAIKVLPVTALDSEAAVARFYQEVKVAAQLTHPNIVHAYDAGEHHGFHYLVMEYVDGHDLAQVLSQLGPIPPMLALDYLSQACAGLEYAHRKGVVHRDIKPSNLLLDKEGTIKILDMGLARIGGGFDQESSAHLTTTGQMMGTVEYMSPEQAEDTRMADARSDIYSLGCTLYRLVTGSGPFSRDTVVKTILAHRDAPLPVIDSGFPEDDLVNQLLHRMIAKKPDDRFQNVTLLLESIRQIEQGEPPLSLKPEPILDVAPDAGTAVAYRVSPADAMDGSIPEAIIPDADSTDAEDGITVISRGSSTGDPSFPESSDRPPSTSSEVVYIKDNSLRGQFKEMADPLRSALLPVAATTFQAMGTAAKKTGETVNWIGSNPSLAILVRGIISILLTGTVAWVLGPMTWRAANRQLRLIRDGHADPSGRWMIKTGKYLSIASFFLSFIAVVALIVAISNM